MAVRPTSRAGIEEQNGLLLDRYLGRLCAFNACPKGKRECEVPGCGDAPFLRQHEAFEWWADTLAPGKAVRLFDRAAGTVAKAAELPLPEAAESG